MHIHRNTVENTDMAEVTVSWEINKKVAHLKTYVFCKKPFCTLSRFTPCTFFPWGANFINVFMNLLNYLKLKSYTILSLLNQQKEC